MKLRFRLMIMFFSIILISLLFLGAIIFKNSERILIKNTLSDLKTLSILTEARVLDIFEHYQEELLIASKRVALYQALDQYYSDSSLENKGKLESALKSFVPVQADLEEMYVFDTHGKCLAGTTGQWDGQDVSSNPFFIQGLSGQYLNFLKRSPADKFAGQLVMSTFIKPHDEIEGVILIVINKDILSEITRTNLQVGETLDILLGRKNANGDAEFIAQRRFEDDKNAMPIIPKERVDIPMTKALAGQDSVMDAGVDYRGQHVLAATRFIDKLGIGVVVKVDRNEFLIPVHELTKIVFIFGGIIVFFTIFIAFIIAQSLTTPIENLSRYADAIASGSSAAVPTTPEGDEVDEIGILSRSLMSMSQKLIQSNKNLESEVIARTRELEKRLFELEQLNQITTGREFQMIELKKQINSLSKKLNLKEPYDLSFLTDKQRGA